VCAKQKVNTVDVNLIPQEVEVGVDVELGGGGPTDAARFFTLAEYFSRVYDTLQEAPFKRRYLIDSLLNDSMFEAIAGRGRLQDTLNFPLPGNRQVQLRPPTAASSKFITVAGSFMQCLGQILANPEPEKYDSRQYADIKAKVNQLVIYFSTNTAPKLTFFARMIEELTILKKGGVPSRNQIVDSLSRLVGANDQAEERAAIERAAEERAQADRALQEAQRLEQDRLSVEAAQQELARNAREAFERAAQERLEAEAAERNAAALIAQREAVEREADRLAAEREADRLAAERAAAERAAAERAAAEREAAERAAAERAAAEREQVVVRRPSLFVGPKRGSGIQRTTAAAAERLAEERMRMQQEEEDRRRRNEAEELRIQMARQLDQRRLEDNAARDLRQEVINLQRLEYAAQLNASVNTFAIAILDSPQYILAVFQQPRLVMDTINGLLVQAERDPEYMTRETQMILLSILFILGYAFDLVSRITTVLSQIVSSLAPAQDQMVNDSIIAFGAWIFIIVMRLVLRPLVLAPQDAPRPPPYEEVRLAIEDQFQYGLFQTIFARVPNLDVIQQVIQQVLSVIPRSFPINRQQAMGLFRITRRRALTQGALEQLRDYIDTPLLLEDLDRSAQNMVQSIYPIFRRVTSPELVVTRPRPRLLLDLDRSAQVAPVEASPLSPLPSPISPSRLDDTGRLETLTPPRRAAEVLSNIVDAGVPSPLQPPIEQASPEALPSPIALASPVALASPAMRQSPVFASPAVASPAVASPAYASPVGLPSPIDLLSPFEVASPAPSVLPSPIPFVSSNAFQSSEQSRLLPIPQLPEFDAFQDTEEVIDYALGDEANAFLRTLTPRELAFFEGIRKFYGNGREETRTRSRQDVKDYENILDLYYREEQGLSEKIDRWRLRKGFSKTFFFQAKPASKAYILSSILYPNNDKPWQWPRAEFARTNL